MQNLSDSSAEQVLACAGKAQAGGAQHHWGSSQRGEAAERIGLSSWPRSNGQHPFPEAGKPFAAAISKSWDPVVPLCYKSKQNLKGLVRNKESENFRPGRIHRSQNCSDVIWNPPFIYIFGHQKVGHEIQRTQGSVLSRSSWEETENIKILSSVEKKINWPRKIDQGKFCLLELS